MTDAAPTGARIDTSTARTLHIEVVWGDIARADGEVCAVGHYIGVLPQYAEEALDKAISGVAPDAREPADRAALLLTQLTERGALRGELGEIDFFPLAGGRLAAIAGMGSSGSFDRLRLERLARALVSCVGMLPAHNTISTVLIGSGAGSDLGVSDCVEAIVKGTVCTLAANPRLRLDRLQIVELYLDRALEARACLQNAADTHGPEWAAGALTVQVHPSVRDEARLGGRIGKAFGCSMLLGALAEIAGSGDGTQESPILAPLLARLPVDEAMKTEVRKLLSDTRGARRETDDIERLRAMAMEFRIRKDDGTVRREEHPVRLGFWSDRDRIRATAITDTVTVTERDLADRLALVTEAVGRLRNPEPTTQASDAARLFRLVVHPDLRQLVTEDQRPLIVEVDQTLASVQWEMLPGRDARPLGVMRPVARQLRTRYSPRPAEAGARRLLRALVIGDPGDPARGEDLPHARDEAKGVRDILVRTLGADRVVTLIGAPAAGTGAGPLSKEGIPPADYVDVVDLLLSGDFDIVHYCGHATPLEAGWRFKGGVLTAADLEGILRAPSLVVANACLTAPARPSEERGDHDEREDRPCHHNLVASLADGFFRCGIANYIGTAWEVESKPAKAFAERFYTELFAGKKIGEAVRLARESLYASSCATTCVWGAYQHYGDPRKTVP